MIKSSENILSIKHRCELLAVARSTIYYQPKIVENDDTIIVNEIRDIYQKYPFYGYRRILVSLRQMGIPINHKRLQRLLALAGIKAVYPGKKTSIRNPEHRVFPYLLKGLKIERPNQVWKVDITYIKMRHGFVYLICLIDVFSRKIMGWALSTFLDTKSCIEALDNALRYATPEIVNSDQGCQFTSFLWVELLAQKNIVISMDGKGRWADNVYIERLWRSIKYESVYLHSFDIVEQARTALGDYIKFYNQQRPHQSLNYHTPLDIYDLKRIPTKQELFEKFSLQTNLNPEVIMSPKFV